jgi:hypothetical protein
MVWDGRYKLVRGFDPDRGKGSSTPLLLFDHPADPGENDNVAARREDVVTRLSKLLA